VYSKQGLAPSTESVPVFVFTRSRNNASKLGLAPSAVPVPVCDQTLPEQRQPTVSPFAA